MHLFKQYVNNYYNVQAVTKEWYDLFCIVTAIYQFIEYLCFLANRLQYFPFHIST